MTCSRIVIALQEFLHQIQYSISLNLSEKEMIFGVGLGIIAWLGGRRKPHIRSCYCIFLILYIALLRRTPIHHESIRWRLQFGVNTKSWAGNLLNILLYIPLGWTGAQIQSQKNWMKLLLLGASLSISCECVQYLTGRGCADVSDVLWNVVGMGVGILGCDIKYV